MENEAASPARHRFPLAEVVVAGWVVLIAGLMVLGADLLWVVAMGDVVRSQWSIPQGIPFATAPQAQWANPVVLAQVLLSWVNAAGWWALPALHLALVAAALGVVVAEGRRLGGSEARISVGVSLLVVGGASALVVLRFPTLSLLPFVALVALLRRQDDRPGRAIWWVPPLMLLWGNLHGAVLVGLAVLGVFVVAARGPRLRDRAAVGVASLSCLLLTSAGWRTPAYYVSALGNEAARRGTDLWSRPDLTHPLDLAMVLTALALLTLAWRSLRLWEWLVVAGLLLATVSAARHGVWLLLFLAPVASVAPGRRRAAEGTRREEGAQPAPRWPAVALVLLVGLALVAGQVARRSERLQPPAASLVAAVRGAAGTSPVLSTEPAAETFAQAGIRVWAANPVDAFTRPAQRAFLDFLHDCTVPADASIRVAVVDSRCRAGLSGAGWAVVTSADGLTVFRRPATP
jgi:hypothetical protein